MEVVFLEPFRAPFRERHRTGKPCQVRVSECTLCLSICHDGHVRNCRDK